MSEEKMSIQDAVNQAAAIQLKEQEAKPVEVKEEVKEEVKPEVKEEPKKEEKEDEEETEEETEENPEDDELKQALQIARLLKDPIQAVKFGQALVNAYGESTKGASQEVKEESAKDIIAKLEKLVGAENSHLLEPILAVFSELTERQSKIYGQKFQEIEQKAYAEKVNNEITSFVESNKLTPADIKQLDDLAKEYPIGNSVPVKTHLTRLLKLMRAESGGNGNGNGKESKEPNKDKIKQNLKEATKKVESSQELRVIPRPAKDTKFTPRDAMEMALKGETFSE